MKTEKKRSDKTAAHFFPEQSNPYTLTSHIMPERSGFRTKNTTKKSYLAILGLSLLVGGIVIAQEQSDQPQDPVPPPRRHHHPPPPPPVIIALDANHDGVIDASEIANASAALLKLDKNGDGQLTFDELCPPCPKPGHEPGGPEDDGPPPF